MTEPNDAGTVFAAAIVKALHALEDVERAADGLPDEFTAIGIGDFGRELSQFADCLCLELGRWMTSEILI